MRRAACSVRKLWLLWRLAATVAEIRECEAAGIGGPMVEEYRRQARQFRAALAAMEG